MRNIYPDYSETVVSERYLEEIFQLIDKEIRILQAIADQAAIAIENIRLVEDLLSVKEVLETRKLVEKAKEILMKEKEISEDRAYNMIHKKSIDTCKTMKSVAESIILGWEITTKTK